MANAIAVIIPPWVAKIKSTLVESDTTVYQFFPGLMQWRNVDYMERIMLIYGATPGVRFQIKTLFDNMREEAQCEEDPHCLIARIDLSTQFPKCLYLMFRLDRNDAPLMGSYMLHVNDEGLIERVTRMTMC